MLAPIPLAIPSPQEIRQRAYAAVKVCPAPVRRHLARQVRASLALGILRPREVHAAILDADPAASSLRKLLRRGAAKLRRGLRRLPTLGSLPAPILRSQAVRAPTPQDLELLPKLLAACARRGLLTPSTIVEATARRDFGALLELASRAFDRLKRRTAAPARALAGTLGIGDPSCARTADNSRLLFGDGNFLYLAEVFDLNDFVGQLQGPPLPSGALAPDSPLTRAFRRLQEAHQIVDLLDLPQSHEWLAMSGFGMLGETVIDTLARFPGDAQAKPATVDTLLQELVAADLIDDPENEDVHALLVDFLESYQSIQLATSPVPPHPERHPVVRSVLGVVEAWASTLEAQPAVPKAVLSKVGRGFEDSSEETIYPCLTLLPDNAFTRSALQEWCDTTANAGYGVSFSLGTFQPEALLACVERLRIELALFRVATRGLSEVLARCASTTSY